MPIFFKKNPRISGWAPRFCPLHICIDIKVGFLSLFLPFSHQLQCAYNLRVMGVLPSHNKRELPKQLHCVVMIYSQVLNIINIENVFEPNAFMHSAPSTAI